MVSQETEERLIKEFAQFEWALIGFMPLQTEQLAIGQVDHSWLVIRKMPYGGIERRAGITIGIAGQEFVDLQAFFQGKESGMAPQQHGFFDRELPSVPRCLPYFLPLAERQGQQRPQVIDV